MGVYGHMVEVDANQNMTEGVAWSDQVTSMASCISRCITDRLCLWLVYGTDTRICYLGNTANPTVFAVQEARHQFFIKREVEENKCT